MTIQDLADHINALIAEGHGEAEVWISTWHPKIREYDSQTAAHIENYVNAEAVKDGCYSIIICAEKDPTIYF